VIELALTVALSTEQPSRVAARHIVLQQDCRFASFHDEVRCAMVITIPAAPAREERAYRYECIYTVTGRTGRCIARTALPSDPVARQQLDGLVSRSQRFRWGRIATGPGDLPLSIRLHYASDWRPGNAEPETDLD
jgi:hypothetical protein